MNNKTNKLSLLEGSIWFNGEFVKWQNAKFHVLSHGLHYGTGVFEGVRAYETPKGSAIFRLNDHTNRFFDSAKIVGIDIPYSFDEINQAQLDVVSANNLSNAYIRPLAFLDDTSLGLTVNQHETNVIIAAMNWGAYLGTEGLEKGIAVGISSFRRPDPLATMIHAKVTGNYINSVLANQEAINNGYEEALLLDKNGYVAEGSGENIFLVFNNKLVTPTCESSLNGITRQTICELAKNLDIPITERQIARDELYIADEAFFTGTAAEVTPIRQIDNVKLGNGSRGPITKKIQKMYFDCVQGKLDGYDHYLALNETEAKKVA